MMMRVFAAMIMVPLVACASVEERTDARSGTGFAPNTIEASPVAQPVAVEARMKGFEPVPVVAASGNAANREEAAAVALAAGGSNAGVWTPMTVGGATYALRQVRADGYDFAVAEVQTGDAATGAALLSPVKIRTGCLTSGQTWQDDGRIAVALDCS